MVHAGFKTRKISGKAKGHFFYFKDPKAEKQ